jgi:hypothetical protein
MCGAAARKVAGDDIVQAAPPWATAAELDARMASFGYILRDAHRDKTTDFNFCSHRFQQKEDGTYGAYLTNYQKMIFGFLVMKKLSVENMWGLYEEISYMPPHLAIPILEFVFDHMLALPGPAEC